MFIGGFQLVRGGGSSIDEKADEPANYWDSFLQSVTTKFMHELLNTSYI